MNKLDRRNLELLPEWQFLRGHILVLIKDYTEDMLDAALKGDVPRVMALAGMVKAFKAAIELPGELLSSSGEAA